MGYENRQKAVALAVTHCETKGWAAIPANIVLALDELGLLHEIAEPMTADIYAQFMIELEQAAQRRQNGEE